MTRKRAIWISMALAAGLLLFFLLRPNPTPPGAEAGGNEAENSENKGDSYAHRGAGPTLTDFSRHAPEPPDLPRADLRGRVIRPDNSPVSGASVTILGYPAGERAAVMSERTRETDADGTFSFPGALIGDYLLEARHGGEVSATVRAALTTSSEPVTLMLMEGAALTVEVRSLRENQPVSGALVRLGVGDKQFGGTDAFTETRSDGDGLARFEGVVSTGIHTIYAEAPGYLPGTVTLLPGANPRRESWQATVHLDSNVATINGRVVDTRGSPVPGAKVGWTLGELEASIGLFDPLPNPSLEGAAISDEDGRFSLPVTPGTGCLMAVPPRRETGMTCGVAVRVGTTSEEVEIVVGDGGRVTGVVLDNGEPAAGATVFLTMAQWVHQPMFANAYRFKTSADRRGRFEFTGVDRMELLAYAHSKESSSELVDVDLESNASADIVIELEHTGRITGRVTDESGGGVAFAAVEYFAMPDHDRETSIVDEKVVLAEVYTKAASIGRVLTDPEGNFAISGLPPSEYAINATRTVSSSVPPSYARAEKLRVKIGEHVDLVVPDNSAIKGRVVYEDGEAATEFRVSFAYYTRKYSPDSFAPPHQIETEDGSFRIPEVPKGRYGLEITGPEVVPHRIDGPIEVGGADTDLGTIRVGRGTERTGKIVDRLGEPVLGANLQMTTGDLSGPYHLEQSGVGGTFEVPAIRANEKIRIRAQLSSQTSSWQAFPADGPVELLMDGEGNGGIEGVLIDSFPVDRRNVVLTLPGEGEPGPELPIAQATEVNDNGKFSFVEVGPGTYMLWVRRHANDPAGPGWWTHPEHVTVKAMKETQVVTNISTGAGSGGGGAPGGQR